MEQTVLNRVMELKKIEREAKEERVALEQQLFEHYKPLLTKKSNTFRDGDYKISIQINEKYRIREGFAPPPDADIYEPALSQKKCVQYLGAEWLEQYENAPTIKVSIE